MPGVPASETNPMTSPFSMREIKLLDLLMLIEIMKALQRLLYLIMFKEKSGRARIFCQDKVNGF